MPNGPSNKRAWLYTGLAVAPGVAMARRPTLDERTPRVIVPRRAPVVLAGDRTATALEPTLRKMLSDHGRQLERAQLHALAQAPLPSGHCVVLTDLPIDAIVAIATGLRRSGVRVVAVPPVSAGNVPRPAAEALRAAQVAVVPTRRVVAPTAGMPTAISFAALAGAIWTYIR